MASVETVRGDSHGGARVGWVGGRHHFRNTVTIMSGLLSGAQGPSTS